MPLPNAVPPWPVGSAVTITPCKAALQALDVHWRWQIGSDWTPVLFSAVGDVFFQVKAGTVWWLSTATGGLEQVADSRDHFAELLAGERADEWFLPGLVDVLRLQGKVLRPGQCYTFDILPLLAEGSFSAENMRPAATADHYAMSGRLIGSLRHLPDGARVQLPPFDFPGVRAA